MRVVVVIPAYNEAARIEPVIRGLLPQVHRVVVVDDGSADATARVAARGGATVVRHALNRDQGAALKTGTEKALSLGADVIVHFDADGQHDPASLPALVEPIRRGEADVVFGSRFLGVAADGMPWGRRLLLLAARQFNTLALGIPGSFSDPQSGLRAMTAAAARQIDFRQDGKAHCSEILRLVSRLPLRAREVPVQVRYSAETLAKGNKTSDAIDIVWQLLLGAFQR